MKDNRFDTEAEQWDLNPEKTYRANLFAKEIIDFIHPDKSFTAMEFGCGTGLLSVALKNNFKSITLVDDSLGMIRVLKDKISKNKLNHFKPICANLLQEKVDLDNFDVIYSMMTLHHIQNLNQILQSFYSELNTGGYLCIADLVKEDGSFHEEYPDFDGHNGFEKEELILLLHNNGFKEKFYKVVYEIEEKKKGKLKKYPLFLMIAKKENSKDKNRKK